MRIKRLMGFLKMKCIAAIQDLLLGLRAVQVPCRHRGRSFLVGNNGRTKYIPAGCPANGGSYSRG